MKLRAEMLDIAFRRIAPEKPLSKLLLDWFQPPTEAEYRGWFLDVSETALSGYSMDEKELLFQEAFLSGAAAGKKPMQPPFFLLADYAEKVLDERDHQVCFRFHEALEWRGAYLNLGQDTIITAWLARRLLPDREPPSFTWPAVIPGDNRILEQILNREGISENHAHLYGSSAVFPLNWARLMTYPRLDGGAGDWLEEHLQSRPSRGGKDNQLSLKKKLLLAALLRALLFFRMRGAAVPDTLTDVVGQDVRALRRRLRLLCGGTSDAGEGPGALYLYQLVDTLVFQARHALFSQPGGAPPVCLDYAAALLTAEELRGEERILAPERKFLFHWFRRCFAGRAGGEEEWLFYLYLLLKSDFRQELIQVNRETGFRNFQNYDRRKKDLWSPPEAGDGYWNEAYLTAIAAPLREQPIRSLELRVSPLKTASENFRNIYEIDRAALFLRQEIPPADRMDWETEEADEPRWFYVLHFIKEKDRTETVPLLTCRHAAKREALWHQARALMEALARHPYLRRRIRGIDACANEIGCRPEVFAVVFRFLQDCPIHLFSPAKFFPPDSLRIPPLLEATCHAGEDFLDIADGLRAIDEAVCFLNLRRGSRLGHALALGVDAAAHYARKHGCVVLPKQDLLDNLVWLLFRSGELGLVMEPRLRADLENRAEDLLTELYRKNLPGVTVSLRDDYGSWLLRGDAPECCRNEDGVIRFHERPNLEEYAPYAANRFPARREELDNCRKNRSVSVLLYYHYQYNKAVKEAGQVPVLFPIRDGYQRFMGEMQRALQRELDQLGVSIECNASSNQLIGTFGPYQRHPVFRFNTAGLYERNGAVQMHASLNTDDQGVFDTSLSFEYALIAAALTGAKDADGVRLYTDREVEDYIRNLQRMGNEQSFAGADPRYRPRAEDGKEPPWKMSFRKSR